jgi:hypothetical protein
MGDVTSPGARPCVKVMQVLLHTSSALYFTLRPRTTSNLVMVYSQPNIGVFSHVDYGVPIQLRNERFSELPFLFEALCNLSFECSSRTAILKTSSQVVINPLLKAPILCVASIRPGAYAIFSCRTLSIFIVLPFGSVSSCVQGDNAQNVFANFISFDQPELDSRRLSRVAKCSADAS